VAEFDELFRSAVAIDRPAPTRLRLVLAESGGVAERARELAARESSCCSFFAFDVSAADGRVVVDAQVPPGHTVVLDGLAAQAAAVAGGWLSGRDQLARRRPRAK
jgi:hypothetical protein